MMRQTFLGYVSLGLLLCGSAFAKPISLTDEAETLNPLSAPQVTHGLEIPLRVLGLEPINFGPFGEESLYANQESESKSWRSPHAYDHAGAYHYGKSCRRGHPIETDGD